ncbi:MAG: very short patch repair endonuclease [Endomicrobium sp.]|jgi:DNA mismatch endonuclease (patch repair protein)|nr:very short patch repair endonuclease [Endomicrobium sp.]
MSDIFDKEKRSAIMRRVKSSKNTSTELKLISIFKENDIKGWRRGSKVEGKPDFVFKCGKIAVFTDGCFWHGHKCRNTTPKDNGGYWTAKIIRNKKRDKDIAEYLKQSGWQVIRIWECELKNKNRTKLLLKLSPIVKNQPIK